MGVHKDDWLRLVKKFRTKPLIDTSPVVEEMQIQGETFLSVRRSYLGRDFWREYGGMLFMGLLSIDHWSRHPIICGAVDTSFLVIILQHFLRVGYMTCLPGGDLRIRYGRWPFCREVILDAEQLHCCETLVPFHKWSKKESGKLAFVLTHRSYPDTAVRIAAYVKREEMGDMVHALRRLITSGAETANTVELEGTAASPAEIDRNARRCSWCGDSLVVSSDGIAKAFRSRWELAWLAAPAASVLWFIFLLIHWDATNTVIAAGLNVAVACLGAGLFALLWCLFKKPTCLFDGNSRRIVLGIADALPDGTRELTFEDVQAVQMCTWFSGVDEAANYETNLVIRHCSRVRVAVMKNRKKARAYENSRRLAEHLGVEFLDHTLAEK